MNLDHETLSHHDALLIAQSLRGTARVSAIARATRLSRQRIYRLLPLARQILERSIDGAH
jgi:DNA-binding phage protein